MALKLSRAELKAQLAACSAARTTLEGELAAALVDRDAWKAKYEALVAQLVAAMQPPPQKGASADGPFQNLQAAERDRELDMLKAAGCKWFRIGVWYGSASLAYPAIDAAIARGMKVLPSLGAIGQVPTAANFAVFAKNVAGAMKARGVAAYEIWNEANVVNFWPTGPDVAAYTALLNAAYDAIKSVDAGATIVSSGLSPAANDPPRTIDPVDFLKGMLARGAKFDAVGWHPYCQPAMPGDTDWWSTFQKMRVAQQLTPKPFWGTEFGAHTATTGVTPDKQAAMIAEAYDIWRPTDGPLFLYQLRDGGIDPTNDQHRYGVVNRDFSPKPGYAAYKAA